MAKQALIGGAYQARSLIAEAQRCVNLYVEPNPPDAPFPTTHYPTPGLVLLSSPPAAAPARGAYRASNGNAFLVVGNTLYLVSAAGIWTTVGVLATSTGQVSMVDNGDDLLLVDGTAAGYTCLIDGSGFAAVTDPNFYGATRVDILDGFFLLNQPGTRNFYISLFNQVAFDPLDIAAKITYPDKLVASIAVRREIWQIGQLTTEVWYNTGASDFTFGRMPGVFIEHGCTAVYSIAKTDSQVFWLAQDLQGHAMVVMGENYKATRISNYAIEEAIRKYSRIDDAIGFTYQQGGHSFYQLTFPTADVTWVYDIGVSAQIGQQCWHQRAWSDEDGVLRRHRANVHVFAYGMNLVGDWESGDLYQLSLDDYTDNGDAVQRIRSFPHIKNNNKRVTYNCLMAEIEVGKVPGRLAGNPVEIWLRWSDDGGVSWSNPVRQSAGSTGQTKTRPQWNRLGMATDRVFELAWSHDAKTALLGADVDPQASET